MKRPGSFSPKRRRIAGAVLFSLVAAFVAVASACSNQGEGERCESANRDDDCATSDGLHCYPANQLINTSSDRCCPIDRTKAVNPVCKLPSGLGDGSTTPADTGPPPSSDAGNKDSAASDAADAADATDAAEDADAADQ